MKRSTILTAVIGVLLIHGSAFAAPQTKGQQKCINAMNKGMAKIAGAQNKANAKCVKGRAKDASSDAFACLIAADPKVTAAENKNIDQETKACTEAPTFGYSSANNVNNRAQYEAYALAPEVFGDNSGIAVCADDKAACKCQSKALKSASKLYKAHLKVYNKCKKSGLKAKTSPFDDGADLTACISTDPKSKIAKAVTKLNDAITDKCTGVATPFGEGDCAALTGAALSNCLEDRVRCHACLTESLSDDLTFDCDQYDDGNSENGSCFDDF